MALEQLLRSPFATSRQLEVVAGHFTFVALLKRPLLSVMQYVYSCVQSKFSSKQRLWDSVQREIRWTLALLPVREARLQQTVSSCIVASDASLDGEGVCSA